MTVTKKFLEAMSYLNVRQLDDGTWIGLLPLLFTTGLHIGLDEVGWSKRYCFENMFDAMKECNKLNSFDDVPVGWIAKRPE